MSLRTPLHLCPIFLILMGCSLLTNRPAFAEAKPNLVVYWGQDPAGPWFPNNLEQPLYDICLRPGYDIINIGFVISFIDPRQGGAPDLNFAEHCETPFPGYPYVLNCTQIGVDITRCQRAGKKVLISLGGGVGQYGFTSELQATTFATTFWNMFLAGSSSGVLRPFGNAVLDGVDLDIEGGTLINIQTYSVFVNALRKLMLTDTTRTYLVSGTPQCPFPDGYMGPKPGTVIGDTPSSFDHLNVQFYNNFCGLNGGVAGLEAAFKKWADWALSLPSTSRRPKIVLGLPASTRSSASATDYIPPETLGPIITAINSNYSSIFGGVMLWDASWDQQNMIGSQTYGSTIAKFLV